MNKEELLALDESLLYLNEGKIMDSIKLAVEKFKTSVRKFIEKAKNFLKSISIKPLKEKIQSIIDKAKKMLSKKIYGEDELEEAINELKDTEEAFKDISLQANCIIRLGKIIFSYKNKNVKILNTVKKAIDDINNPTKTYKYFRDSIFGIHNVTRKDQSEWDKKYFEELEEWYVNGNIANSEEFYLYCAEVHDYLVSKHKL